MNTKTADALFVALVRLLQTSMDLPLDMYAPRKPLEPFYTARHEAICQVREFCGGKSLDETLRVAGARAEAIKQPPAQTAPSAPTQPSLAIAGEGEEANQNG